MHNYAIISVTALICYLFLFVTFMAARKNRLILSFMEVLLTMIVWTGGSLFMRIGMFPSVSFWFYVSMAGIFLFSPSLFQFVKVYLGEERRFGVSWLTACLAAVWVLNCFWPVFVHAPEQIVTEQGTQFVYDFSWLVLVPLVNVGAILVRFICMICDASKRDKKTLEELSPILFGLGAIVLGHVLLILPVFIGIPVDMLGGIPFVCCLFYILYRRRIFQMELLSSRASCYFVAMVIAVVAYIDIIPILDQWMERVPGLTQAQSTLVISIVVMASIWIIYHVLQEFLDRIFGREDSERSRQLQLFTEQVSRLMEVQEILEHMDCTMTKGLGLEKAFIFLKNPDDVYCHIRVNSNDSRTDIPLDEIMVSEMKNSRGILWMKDYRSSEAFRTVSEERKKRLQEYRIECGVLLRTGGEEIGAILIPSRKNGRKLKPGDVDFLNSLSAVASIAIRNARLYEKAMEDSRRDDLTGAVNRRYFLECLEKCRVQGECEFGCLIMVSVDDFKLYNQLYGEDEGDRVLCQIAKTMLDVVGERGIVARYSGKVFSVMLPNHTERETHQVAAEFSERIAGLNIQEQETMMKTVTVSCGIALGICRTSDFREVLKRAEQALFYAKQAGKNRIVIYTEGTPNIRENPMEYREGVYSEYASTVYALTAAIDAKDHYTFSHSEQVAYYARQLAIAYGMNKEGIQIVYEAGLLHDIGKIGIDEHILNKPGKLEPEEYEIMKRHVELSIGIIRHLPSLDYVIPAVIGHHERYDGKGYPRGIRGEAIPLMARILCIADSFDAMISERSYKQAMPVERALEILQEEAGRQFDPILAPMFVEIVKKGKVKLPSEN